MLSIAPATNGKSQNTFTACDGKLKMINSQFLTNAISQIFSRNTVSSLLASVNIVMSKIYTAKFPELVERFVTGSVEAVNWCEGFAPCLPADLVRIKIAQ